MLENRLQSKSTDNLAVNHPSNTIYVGVTLSSLTVLLSWWQTIPLKKQFVLLGGWHLIDICHVPLGGLTSKWLFVISSCVHFESATKLPMHQECLPLSVLRGLLCQGGRGEISQNGRLPFWFYRESIQITDEKHT